MGNHEYEQLSFGDFRRHDNEHRILQVLLDGKRQFRFSDEELTYYDLPETFWRNLTSTEDLAVLITKVTRTDGSYEVDLADNYIDVVAKRESRIEQLDAISGRLEGFKWWEHNHAFKFTLFANGQTYNIQLHGHGLTEVFVPDPFNQ